MMKTCEVTDQAEKEELSLNGSKIFNKDSPNHSSPKNCCVCLNNFLALNSLSKTDESGFNLLKKLQINIPQINWQIVYFLCEPCTNLLNIVHNFRETCLKSEIRRQELEVSNVEKFDDIYNYSPDCEDNGICDDDLKDFYDDNDTLKDEKEDKQNILAHMVDNNGKEEQESENSSKRKRKIQTFPCEVCPRVFLSSTTLTKHCVSEHGMIDRNVRPFACSRCKSRFSNSSNLLQHIKYHDAIRSNICTYCGKGFITKTDLNIHEKQHLNKREYKCDICNKCYNTHKDLRSHKLVVHTDPESWKYFCQICNKRFPIKSNYDGHMRRHTGDKKFECHLCSKKFTDKCVLQRHMRTHTNVRDFQCSECSREYKDKRVMQIHMARVHGIGLGNIKLPSKERKYQCHICPNAYYAKNKLTRHLYTHSGEKPFRCTVCDKKFNDKSYLKQHMKICHNVDTTIER